MIQNGEAIEERIDKVDYIKIKKALHGEKIHPPTHKYMRKRDAEKQEKINIIFLNVYGYSW